MGNINNTNKHYYNTINKFNKSNNQIMSFFTKHNQSVKLDEIKNMENMLTKHLNDFIHKDDHHVNENIKCVLYLDDFYDLLAHPIYKRYIQIYERKLYGYLNPDASEKIIKSNREISPYLFDLINNELIKIIDENFKTELLIRSNYVTVQKLNANIKNIMESFENLEGENLTTVSQQLIQMIRSKKNLMNELTENQIVIISDNDMILEIEKIKKFILKSYSILKKTRHSIEKDKIDKIDNIIKIIFSNYEDQDLELFFDTNDNIPNVNLIQVVQEEFKQHNIIEDIE